MIGPWVLVIRSLIIQSSNEHRGLLLGIGGLACFGAEGTRVAGLGVEWQN